MTDTYDEAPPRDLDPDELDAIEHANRPSRNGHPPRPAVAPAALPEARGAEEALLGAAILHPQNIEDAQAAGITAPAFQIPAHQHIWHAIEARHNQGEPVDAVLLAHTLDQHGLLERSGGPGRLIALQNDAAPLGTTTTYANVILDAHHRRQTIVELDQALTAVRNGTDPAEALHNLHQATTTTTTSLVDFEDVGAVLRGDYQPLQRALLERTDGEALIYPGLIHWLFSTPGIGKTWLAINAAAEAIRAGIGVLYLDWEGNRRLVGLRLQALGITPDEVDEWFHYMRPGAIDTAKGHQLGRWADDMGIGFAVFDGFAKALAACGHDEDKSGPVLTYLHDAVDPLTQQGDGAAVLLLDHVTKDKETRGLWPRGSGAKQGEVSGAAWQLRSRRAFNRQTPGVLELVQAKDREGEVGIDGQVVATVHIDPASDGRLTIRIDPPTTTKTDTGGFRPTIYMERISRYLENENRFGRHPSQADIFDDVEGKKRYLSDALAVLLDEGHVEVDATHKTHRHVTVRPYREADELPKVPDPDLPEEEI